MTTIVHLKNTIHSDSSRMWHIHSLQGALREEGILISRTTIERYMRDLCALEYAVPIKNNGRVTCYKAKKINKYSVISDPNIRFLIKCACSTVFLLGSFLMSIIYCK